MKLELLSTANFLVHLVRLGSTISEAKLNEFKSSLVEVLRRRYRDHWFPEKPFKGSGYRCIRNNGRMDPVIAQACEVCGLDPQVIHATFPSELTLWIDPLEVSYRIGENGSICILYQFTGLNEPWKPNNTKSFFSSEATTTSLDPLDNNCSDTLRKMDYLLDPRKSVNQLAAYISKV